MTDLLHSNTACGSAVFKCKPIRPHRSEKAITRPSGVLTEARSSQELGSFRVAFRSPADHSLDAVVLQFVAN
jgi:hypothetical protein